MRLRIFSLIGLLLVSASAKAADSWSDIASLSDIWALGHYFAPDVACSPDRWDAAFASSAAALSERKTSLPNAQEELMRVSEAFFLPTPEESFDQGLNKSLRPNHIVPGSKLSLLRINAPLTTGERKAWTQAFKAKIVVIDLRSPAGEGVLDLVARSSIFEDASFTADLGAAAQQLPPVQTILYRGLPNETGFSSGYFSSSLVESVTDQERTIAPESASSGPRLVIVGNRHTVLPRAIMAARLRGAVTFISVDGPFQYGGLASTSRGSAAPDPVMRLARFQGFSLSRALAPDGSVDERCANDDDCVSVRARRARLPTASLADASACKSLPAQGEPLLTSEAFPPLANRIFAVAKSYQTLRFFYPVSALLGNDFRSRYTRALEEAAKATTSGEYAFALAHLAAPIPDAHVQIAGKSFFDAFGMGDLPVRTVVSDRKIYVGCTSNDAPGLLAGDLLLKVDGQDVLSRVESIRQVVSTAAFTGEPEVMASRYLFRGGIGSDVRLEVQDTQGHRRELTFKRARATKRCVLPKSQQADSGIAWPAQTVAYIDLSVASPADISAAADALSKAKHLIVDLRGYPLGGAWTLASHLSSENRIQVAEFIAPLLVGRELDLSQYENSSASARKVQVIDGGAQPHIPAKIIVLVDHDTVSQGEHSVLMLKAAGADVLTVGQRTAGADGDLTGIRLPGGLMMTFTGQEVRSLAGSQILGRGIEPDVLVEPTVDDLVAGRDAILQKAMDLTR